VNLARPSYTPTTTSWDEVLKVNPNVVLGQPSYASLPTAARTSPLSTLDFVRPPNSNACDISNAGN
jgi:hypothetical protein